MKTVMAMLVMVLMCGCVSAGRFALVDIDLRTPEQIAAYAKEAEIPYAVPSQNDPVGLKADRTVLTAIWDEIMEVLKVVKGRVRVLPVEWKK